MSYPDKVVVDVDGFGSTQVMKYIPSSSPPAYEKDSASPSNYTICSLFRNGAGTDWNLIAVSGSNYFNGDRDPDADNPEGNYEDSGSQTATVEEYI